MDRHQIALSFWDGMYKDGKQYNFDEEGIKVAIKRAIADFTFRTETKSVVEQMGVESLYKYLSDDFSPNNFVDCFVKYFFSDELITKQEDFDAWHNSQCNRFLKALKGIYPKLAYGKAQKIVNMTFKNAYCLPDGEKQNDEKRYKYCHMPLDSFTLEWVARNIENIDDGELRKGRISPWSKLSNEVDTQNHYTYQQIASAICGYFKDKGETPLMAEFHIWREIQFELAAEAFYAQIINMDESTNSTEKMNKVAHFKKDLSIIEKREYIKKQL